jgi:hypothetical protein
MTRISTCLLLLALGFSPFDAIAQQSGSVSLVGRISPVAMLTPLEAEGAGNPHARFIRAGSDRVIASLFGSANSQGSQLILTLLMRTNTSYELRAALKAAAATPAVSISVDGVRATGGLVVQDAMSSIKTLSVAANLSSADVLVATGSRISRGHLASPDNAIEISIRLELAPSMQSDWSADVIFTIAPGSL